MNPLANLDLILLFFFLGGIASWAKSDLQVPDQISKFLSLFLLLSLGLKGGHEVRIATDLTGIIPILILGLSSCIVIPIYFFHFHKKTLGISNAAALAACFGSVSAVTFIAAQGFLDNEKINSSGFMVAVMALMEIPAIILALYLYQNYQGLKNESSHSPKWASIFSAKSIILLLGGFVIGVLMNEPSWTSIKPVVKDSFKGVLAFFLLDMGIIAQKHLKEAWEHKWKAVLISIFQPLLHGSVVLLLAHYLKIDQGNQVILAALAGSGSYIASPAAIKTNIPEANPSLYVALPLALTFPMNVLFGIPFYIEFSKLLNS